MNTLDVAYELDDSDISLEDVFEYLDDLRDSGVVDMFSAAKYVQAQFGTSHNASHKLLSLWRTSSEERHND